MPSGQAKDSNLEDFFRFSQGWLEKECVEIRMPTKRAA